MAKETIPEKIHRHNNVKLAILVAFFGLLVLNSVKFKYDRCRFFRLKIVHVTRTVKNWIEHSVVTTSFSALGKINYISS